MSSTYSNQYALSANGAFRQQVAVAAVSTAEVVIAEINTTTDHANRLALAQQVLFAPDLWAGRMALAVIEANSNVAAAAPNPGSVVDADVFAAMASIWNSFADGLAALQNTKQI